MHPGLVVKLRPSGPWRIGPDSGARNRVDAIYHCDSLYSAVTSAMARLGSLEEWLDATGRPQEPAAAPAVCFSSCFPFLDDTRYVVPPRTVWPPVSQAISARVRWKSARFVPLDMVQAILAGRRLDENYWTIDGPSECLTPAGGPGPFRTAVRWSAAVDRLTGATERHATACLEFRPGCGLWTVASFADEAARDRWQEPVKAAFRLLADSGFGGERSRGWGRSETPEFEEGTLPEMILPAIRQPLVKPPAEPEAMSQAEAEPAPVALIEEAAPAQPSVVEPPAEPEAVSPAEAEHVPVALIEEAAPEQQPVVEPPTESEAPSQAEAEPAPMALIEEAAPEQPPVEEPPAEPIEAEASVKAPSAIAPLLVEPAEAIEAATAASLGDAESEGWHAEALAPQEPAAEAEASVQMPPEVAPLVSESTEPAEVRPERESPAPVAPTQEEAGAPGAPASQPVAPQPPEPPTPAPGFENALPHWLLSLFTPAPADAVDWKRGDYALVSRGGRVESPAGSGELKKQVHMVVEGSVLLAAAAPRGSAADVAPDGFPHPVYRAGFAVSVPLPKVS